MTNEEFEPIRIRIMKEAYDLADRNDIEGYNSIKGMGGEVQNLIQNTYRFSPEDWQVAIVLECARFANDYVADSFGVHYSVGDEIKKHCGIEDDLNNVRWKANYRYDAKDIK